MKRWLRKIHRWLGIVLAAQVAAWMLSGLYFAWFPIAEIRGEHLTQAASPVGAEAALAAGVPGAVIDELDRALGEAWRLEEAAVRVVAGQVYWRMTGTLGERSFRRLVTPEGRVVPALDEAGARRRAEAVRAGPAPVLAADWIDSVEPGSEYRNGPLPAWRLTMGGEEPFHLYLDAWTGEVTARRSARWRLFDFLWMLHIMDFQAREDFNTPWLQLAALLGLLVALSGVVYWLFTTRPFRRRRKTA